MASNLMLHVYDELEDLIKDKNMKIDTLMVTAYTGNAFYYLAQVLECPEGPLVGLMVTWVTQTIQVGRSRTTRHSWIQ